jgi:hypothetical protein
MTKKEFNFPGQPLIGVTILWGCWLMNVGDETTATQIILDLTEAHFINLEIQFTYVVLAMTLKPRLVCRPNCVTDVDHCLKSTC